MKGLCALWRNSTEEYPLLLLLLLLYITYLMTHRQSTSFYYTSKRFPSMSPSSPVVEY